MISSIPPRQTIVSSRSLPLSSSLQQTDVENTESSSSQNPSDMKSLGEKIIVQAALQSGATESMIDIQWFPDRIVVTVDVNKDDGEGVILMGDSLDDDDLDEIEWEEEDGILYEEDDNLEFDDEDDEGSISDSDAVDLTLIARTINELLSQDGEDSLAYEIAKLHEIEVTTPEFDNVLRGKVMFESYKGFEVMVEHWEEPKKKKKPKAQKEVPPTETVLEPKLKVTEGKLVGREEDVTLINVKGRVVKIKNDKIEAVRLPKAKREKGVK